MSRRSCGCGRIVDPATSAKRPPAEIELREYGLGTRLRGARVLDLGTGDGRLALGAARLGAREVIGADPDPSALRVARRNARSQGAGNVSFRVAAAQDLPFRDERFDLVLLSWVL